MVEEFQYTIKDPNGIHARPAGVLVKKVQSLPVEVTISCHGKSAGLNKLLAVMGLGIRCGDTVIITVQGENASEHAEALKNFFEENL